MKSLITLLAIVIMAAVLFWQYRVSVIALEKHQQLVQDQSVVQGLEKAFRIFFSTAECNKERSGREDIACCPTDKVYTLLCR